MIRLFERLGDQEQSQLPGSCQRKSRSQDEKIPDAHDKNEARNNVDTESQYGQSKEEQNEYEHSKGKRQNVDTTRTKQGTMSREWPARGRTGLSMSEARKNDRMLTQHKQSKEQYRYRKSV